MKSYKEYQEQLQTQTTKSIVQYQLLQVDINNNIELSLKHKAALQRRTNKIIADLQLFNTLTEISPEL